MLRTGDRIARLFAEGNPIQNAIQGGIDAALREHRRNGTSIVVMRDDKTVELGGEEIDHELERIERDGAAARETGPH
jgi:hypothetical protein